MEKIELYNVKSAEFNELIDSAKVELAVNDIHYKKLKNEVKSLKEKHPNIQLFFENEGAIELGKDECKVIQKVLNLYQEMHMYEEEKIFFHGSKVGHKADSINKCDKVSFTVMGPEVVKDEEWAPYVKSTVVFGRCHIIEDIQIAQTRLRQFAMKYYPDEALVEEEKATYGKAVQMFEIEIELHTMPGHPDQYAWSSARANKSSGELDKNLSVGSFCDVQIVTRKTNVVSYLFSDVKQKVESIR